MTALVWIVLASETGLGVVVAALAAAWAQKHWTRTDAHPKPRPVERVRPAQLRKPSTEDHRCTAA